MVKVSQSIVKSWRKCKQDYHYRYVEKLRRKFVARPLKFGTIVHNMIEAHASGDDPFAVLDDIAKRQRKLFAAEVEEYGDIIADLRCIMTEYFAYYDDRDLVYIRRKGKSAEFAFEVEIVPDIILSGKIDGNVQTRNKLRWIVEHKTFGNSVPNEDHRWRNLQGSIYLRVVDILGWPAVEGLCWDYVYSKPPSRPLLLKSGELSQRHIVTLPSRVLEVIEEEGLNPADYVDFLKTVEDGRTHYFQRIFNPVRKSVVDLQFADFVKSAKEIAEHNPKEKPVRTIDRHCDWCSYEPLCRAALTKSDVDYVKEHEFYVHTKDDYDDQNRSD